ncbi:2OG-Fe(II) oxygenase [Kitasatospora sp. NPDC056531]|uniref:2OG-Fe(II) oxygenase n=1 Tax=Kitasatospora sp. NPDC056531 TaxID=3345856 RepID=UPI0036C28708
MESDSTTTLDKVEVHGSPFPHLTVADFLSAEDSESVLAWLEGFDGWTSKSEQHYKSDVHHFPGGNIPADLQGILTPDKLARVRTLMEQSFGVRFQSDYFLLANRYVPGDGTAVHSDFNPDKSHKYFFTHRLIAYFNRSWEPSDGGVLGLFASENPSSLAAQYNPVHNTAAGMAMGTSSYHAVSALRQGIRYCLIFSFTTESGEYQESLEAPRSLTGA